mmetsp:Transcript_18098/g.30431  ORF Transcript_18098/g.30431 Transcript_18098/m.30431 type:complete len:283 (-) Transcript_18098:125-973(-)
MVSPMVSPMGVKKSSLMSCRFSWKPITKSSMPSRRPLPPIRLHGSSSSSTSARCFVSRSANFWLLRTRDSQASRTYCRSKLAVPVNRAWAESSSTLSLLTASRTLHRRPSCRRATPAPSTRPVVSSTVMKRSKLDSAISSSSLNSTFSSSVSCASSMSCTSNSSKSVSTLATAQARICSAARLEAVCMVSSGRLGISSASSTSSMRSSSRSASSKYSSWKLPCNPAAHALSSSSMFSSLLFIDFSASSSSVSTTSWVWSKWAHSVIKASVVCMPFTVSSLRW